MDYSDFADEIEDDNKTFRGFRLVFYLRQPAGLGIEALSSEKINSLLIIRDCGMCVCVFVEVTDCGNSGRRHATAGQYLLHITTWFIGRVAPG